MPPEVNLQPLLLDLDAGISDHFPPSGHFGFHFSRELMVHARLQTKILDGARALARLHADARESRVLLRRDARPRLIDDVAIVLNRPRRDDGRIVEHHLVPAQTTKRLHLRVTIE